MHENSNAYGGYSQTGNVTGNTATVENSDINHVYGGRSIEGDAEDNIVTISGGKIENSVYGGFSGSLAYEEEDPGYYADKDEGDSSSETQGADNPDRNLNGNAIGNRVFIKDGAKVILNVYGGRANNSGNAEGNFVKISEDGSVGNEVFGGYSYYGDAIGNEVEISGGSVGQVVYGGFSESGSAAGNTVKIYSGTVGDQVIGGSVSSYDADSEKTGWASISIESGSAITAENNYVYIYGGTVGSVIGGQVNASSLDLSAGNGIAATATDNHVFISGGTVTGDVYGGYSDSGDATNNTISISGEVDISKSFLYGGQIGSGSTGDKRAGNTLNITNDANHNFGAVDILNFECVHAAFAEAAEISSANAEGTGALLVLTNDAGTNLSQTVVTASGTASLSGSEDAPDKIYII